MGRPTTKTDLITEATLSYEKLTNLLDSLTFEQLESTFDFSNDTKRKEAHWKRDNNIKDVLIHLYEWHQLLLNWVNNNQNNNPLPFIPEPYNWRTYGQLNIDFRDKHQKTSIDLARKLLNQSHLDVLALANTFDNDQLFSKKIYDWVGGGSLGSYFVSSTSSHYQWAIKKINAHLKAQK